MAKIDLQDALDHHQAGRLGEAERLYRQFLLSQPDEPEILNKLGAALAGQGKLNESASILRQALEIDPNLADAAGNLGNVLLIQGDLNEAIKLFNHALKIDPNSIGAHISLGNSLMKQKKFDEAATSYRSALAIDSDFVPAHNGLGAALLSLGQLDEAEIAFGEALDLDPRNAEAYCNIGNLWRNSGNLEKAVESLQRALEIQPGLIEAHINLGNALKSLGDTEGSLESYKNALAIDLKNPETHWNYAQMLLLKGRFKEGWPEYEWRSQCSEFQSMNFSAEGPKWDGDDLNGKSVLLHAEQGLGDTIQFIRFASVIAEQGGEVMVECPPAISWLVQTAPGVRMANKIDRSVPCDFQTSLTSLPHILKIEEETIPAEVPYFSVNTDWAENWGKKLGDEGFRVGINWQGNPSYKADGNRSMALRFFEPLAKIPSVRLISLQKKNGLEQLQSLPAGMIVETLGDDFDEGPDAFIDTSAVMMNLDLIITSDTSVAHLAGALARPVWTLLPFVPDWRWMLDRDDSPWYPSMRLFRQETVGDWVGVFANVEKALRQRLDDS